MIGEHSYTVTAYAEGGAVAETSGKMEITVQICTNNLVPDFALLYRFPLPESGQGSNSFPDAKSAAYISASEDGCIQSFDFKMSDGSDIKDYPELSIDSNTGVVSVATDSTKITQYSIDLVVVTTEAPEPTISTIKDVRVYIECQATSTLLTHPALEKKVVMADLGGSPSITGRFTTSNRLCPIIGHRFVAG